MADAKLDIKAIEKKWQSYWKEHHTFEANPDQRKKFFVTFPYPYINAYQHIGHLFTLMRVEAFAKYKRLQGYNVLFPQGWHATGSPIVQAAKRVAAREPKQMKIMADMGITDEAQLKKFEEPQYWIEFFAPEYKKDYDTLGMGIDWRREFHTTSLNPRYDAFIRWQFSKLREKGYCIRGKFPVVWDPKEQVPVGDHDRIEGEGETPQEFTLLKFKLGDVYLMAATLRPETMYGQTNLWVNPSVMYRKAAVDSELWIVSQECAEKLAQQNHSVKIVGEVAGRELIGKRALAPVVEREIVILPASFCDPKKGTGIVTSVPSDAPDDWMGLVDLKNNPAELAQYGLHPSDIEGIAIIEIIDSQELGRRAAIKVCEDMGITSGRERKKLEEAKKLVYKVGFYEGTMLESCGPYAGMKVEQAKEAIKQVLLKKGKAALHYELTGRVVSRSLTECVVKIVADQWFLDYGNPEWKSFAHKCLGNLRLYPDKARQQFDYVIDWLRAWACTRESGLGTRLPWDEQWLIESLSDSTIYMAFYTISHILQSVPEEQIDDALFDYVFLKDNSAKVACGKENADAMRAEFEYWYPLDFRNSGKDLIQNHLVFFIFNHTAVFPEDKWPRGIGVNGWVTVDGQKMSKSLGNMIPARRVAADYGADASRFTILSGGEGMDDPNWDSRLALSVQGKLEQMYLFALDCNGRGRDGELAIDLWMRSELHRIIRKVTASMEETMFRSALQGIFFELTKAIRWYLRRCAGVPNKELISQVIEAQLIMLAPFTPHICEETWHALGKKGSILDASWPAYVDSLIEEKDSEGFISTVLDDIGQVLKLTKIAQPKKIMLFTSPLWKYELFGLLRQALQESHSPKDIIGRVMATKLKRHSKDAIKIVSSFIRKGNVPDTLGHEKELEALTQAKGFLEAEFSAQIEIARAEDSVEEKAKLASPGKPAMVVA
ncbi:TPA: leucine--tRNA ligase [Candidatus Woesearchaeota archaeon]|nr:leucine--tRNA ligase [Candidatus Woesearchaeota archaeon]